MGRQEEYRTKSQEGERYRLTTRYARTALYLLTSFAGRQQSMTSIIRYQKMADNFQRSGSVSNAHVGHEFEQFAIVALAKKGIEVVRNYSVEVGVGKLRKPHSFDLGSDTPPILVECKSHRWTSGNNVPSAKISVWNEAMYYFRCAPQKYRKIFFVLRDERRTTGETLAAYYVHTYPHLIPESVEIWEYDEATMETKVVLVSSSAGYIVLT